MTRTMQVPATQHQENPGWWASIKNNLSRAYNGIIDYVVNPFSGLGNYLKNNKNPDKDEINSLRQKHFNLISAVAKNRNPDYNAATKAITKDTKAYMQKIIKQEEQKLGKPPCKYAIATLGSLARQETGPITDLEIAILPERKDIETYKYFYQLTQNIADRLFLLGEHPDIGGKGLRMDEADNAPPHLRFFARNATPEQAKALLQEAIYNKQWDKIPYEGSRPFLATPTEFAEYSRENFIQNKETLRKQREAAFEKEWEKILKDPKNKEKLKTQTGTQQLRSEMDFWLDQIYKPFNPRELKTAIGAGNGLGRNIAPLYGDVNLFNQFRSMRESILNKKGADGETLKTKVAKNEMTSDINAIYQKGKSVYLTGELGKTLDIKREFYRFSEQFLTNLGYHYNCKSQNTIDIAKELIKRGILSPAFGKKLIDLMQFATELKLKEQCVLKRQGFAAYFDLEEFNTDKEDLEKDIKNLKIAIDYLKKVNPKSSEIAAKERELVKLEHKLEHLLEMAPGRIFSEEDVKRLKAILPFTKEIFKEATEWTQGKSKLGFVDKPQTAKTKPVPPKQPSVLRSRQLKAQVVKPAVLPLPKNPPVKIEQQPELPKPQNNLLFSPKQALNNKPNAGVNKLKERRQAALARRRNRM